ETGNQVTQYIHGTTLADSGIASSLLLRAVIYPDLGEVFYTYNRQSEITSTTDQNGTVHVIERDLLARQTQDRVITLGAGVDGTVRRLQTAYDVRGNAHQVTSFDSPAVGSGNIVNEVLHLYNDFNQT